MKMIDKRIKEITRVIVTVCTFIALILLSFLPKSREKTSPTHSVIIPMFKEKFMEDKTGKVQNIELESQPYIQIHPVLSRNVLMFHDRAEYITETGKNQTYTSPENTTYPLNRHPELSKNSNITDYNKGSRATLETNPIVRLLKGTYAAAEVTSSTDIIESLLSHTKTQSRGAVYPDDTECRSFHSVNVTDVCSFVKNVSDCQPSRGFINYIQWIYCDFSHNLLPAALIISIIWWIFLFVGLAVTADDFLCPALSVISKTLHLSHNIAGVTFLAFGNGAPDVFSAISAVDASSNGDAGLAFGALFGAGIFVTTVVAGAVAFIRPVHLMQRPFLRDVIFYIAASFWAFYILWTRRMTMLEAIGFILLYVLYVLVVIIGRYIRQKFYARALSTIDINANAGDVASPYGITSDGYTEIAPNNDDDEGDHSSLPSGHPGDTPCIEMQSPRIEFLSIINPFTYDKEDRYYVKVYDIFKAPMTFILTVTIPLVDDKKPRRNWNRHLCCLQCIIGPIFVIFATKVGLTVIGGVLPVYAIVITISTVLAAIVYCTSSNSTPPIYHALFAYLGFLVAVVWIYSISNEIVNLLKAFGVVLNISDTVLGLTLLAWGNSIGDLLLGIGISFTMHTIKLGGDVKVKLLDMVLISFLLASLVSSLVIVVATRFWISRGYSIYLWAYYVLFLVIAFLTSFQIIHVNYFT